MGRLTAELVFNSLAFVNCLQEVELDLRGQALGSIENLGATEDQYEVIDLSDNEITKVENFPQLGRLTTLLVNANRVSSIASGLGPSLPNLETLSLINNRLQDISDLAPLSELQRLSHLTLVGNPVQKAKHYRAYLIARLPLLRTLDFKKIKRQERLAAEKLFSSESGQKLLDELTTAGGLKAKPLVAADEAMIVDTEPQDDSLKSLSDDQRAKIIQAIKNAVSMDEVTRLEEALRTGKMPKELQVRT